MNPFIKMTFAAGALLMPVFLLAQDAPTTPTATDSTDTTEGTDSSAGLSESTNLQPIKSPSNNLLKSGDFSEGKSGWSAVGVVVDSGDHKALEITLHPSNTQTAYTNIHAAHGAHAIVTQFDVQASDDMTVDGITPLRIWIREAHRGLFYRIRLDAGQSKRVHFTYEIHGTDSRELTIHFEAAAGKGKLYLSNVIVTESK